MPKELCWKCQEKVAKVMKEYGERSLETVSLALSEFAFVTHCHHEPKEKPCWRCMEEMRIGGKCPHVPKEKPKCWCELEARPFGEFITLNGPMMNVKINFCPQCGRKL